MIRVFLWQHKQLFQGGEELIASWQAQGGKIWIDVEGEEDQVELSIVQALGCHALAINDMQRSNHPPKIENFHQHSFVLYRQLLDIRDDLSLSMQNIALFYQDDFLITVHKQAFVDVDKILEKPHFIDMLKAPAELMCALLRHTANLQLERVLQFEELLSTVEERMAYQANDQLLQELLGYRGCLRRLKRIYDYHEKMFVQLLREENSHSHSKNLQHMIRDVYDKYERLLSLTSLYYDLCGDLSDAYISLSTHRLNHTMQVLTVITAIFIPLSFVAGIYGMNFEGMPELTWRYGYFYVLSLMLVIAISLLVLFKHKKWL